MKCFRTDCSRKAPQDDLFRVNAKGVPGIWACRDHRLEQDSELDDIVDEIKAGRIPPDAEVIGRS